MKLSKKLFAAAFALTAIAQAQEEPNFSLSGEFRPRSEYFGNGGNFTGGSFPAGTATNADEGFVRTTVRAALNADYKASGYKLHLGIQEVFAFGDRQQIATAGNGNIRFQEAWADINLSETSTLKIGRQPLSYDDQRILGGLGWAQQARTHDAAVFKYTKDGYHLDLGASLNTTTDEVFNNTTLFTYRDMGFVRANKKYGALNISALALVNTFQNGTAVSTAGSDKATLLTAGIHADYKVKGLGLHLNAFVQEGNNMVGGYNDVSGAHLISLDADYKINDKFTVLGGIERISGRTNNSAAFFPLYGTNHKFNGLIDRFYVGNHANAGGLNDLHIGANAKLAGAMFKVRGHLFSEAKDIASNGNALGSELDLIVAKKFNGFKLVGGYSQFFEPKLVKDLATTKSTQNWAWLMLIIKPKFL